MPILDIEIVVDADEALTPGLAQRLADIAGDALGTPPGRTWVKLRTLPRAQYAESGGSTPEGIKPVFVSILKQRRPPAAEMQAEIDKIVAGFSAACSRPKDSIHIFYRPEAAGRAAFGGDLVSA